MRRLRDGSHIFYVNGAYKGDDAIGKLMADFRNKGVTGFNYKVLESGVRHFKKERKGREIMCDAVEKYAKRQYKQGIERGIEQSRTAMILKALDNGAAPKDLKIFGIDEDEVRRVMEKAGR